MKTKGPQLWLSAVSAHLKITKQKSLTSLATQQGRRVLPSYLALPRIPEPVTCIVSACLGWWYPWYLARKRINDDKPLGLGVYPAYPVFGQRASWTQCITFLVESAMLHPFNMASLKVASLKTQSFPKSSNKTTQGCHHVIMYHPWVPFQPKIGGRFPFRVPPQDHGVVLHVHGHGAALFQLPRHQKLGQRILRDSTCWKKNWHVNHGLI